MPLFTQARKGSKPFVVLKPFLALTDSNDGRGKVKKSLTKVGTHGQSLDRQGEFLLPDQHLTAVLQSEHLT
jgi:hypothetical protein